MPMHAHARTQFGQLALIPTSKIFTYVLSRESAAYSIMIFVDLVAQVCVLVSTLNDILSK